MNISTVPSLLQVSPHHIPDKTAIVGALISNLDTSGMISVHTSPPTTIVEGIFVLDSVFCLERLFAHSVPRRNTLPIIGVPACHFRTTSFQNRTKILPLRPLFVSISNFFPSYVLFESGHMLCCIFCLGLSACGQVAGAHVARQTLPLMEVSKQL